MYNLAEENNIDVDFFSTRETPSFSLPDTAVMDMSKIETTSEEKVHLAHELGHCMTGSFYNVYSRCDSRSRHEHQADRWAIQKLIPFEELKKAVKEGITDPWELAEHFSVPE